MPDADPENEVDDTEAPTGGLVITPHAHAGRDQISDTQPEHAEHGEADGKSDLPPQGGGPFGDDADGIGHRLEVSVVKMPVSVVMVLSLEHTTEPGRVGPELRLILSPDSGAEETRSDPFGIDRGDTPRL